MRDRADVAPVLDMAIVLAQFGNRHAVHEQTLRRQDVGQRFGTRDEFDRHGAIISSASRRFPDGPLVRVNFHSIDASIRFEVDSTKGWT